MTALRKTSEVSLRYTYGEIRSQSVKVKGPLPPEALAFEDDVTTEAVKKLQDQADLELAGEEWELVDGYDGRK
jgi:hypothetical protein